MQSPDSLQNRYHRQELLEQIGPAGQRRIGASRVLLVGCGALGSTIAELLVRGGAGFIRIADRDIVELTNLQRQVLFDEEDVRRELPKAVAAAQHLRRANSQVTIDPRPVDVHAGNIAELAAPSVDLIVDGTDNAETRYLLNDFAVAHGIPWVYGACVGTEGRVMAIVPGRTACLRCVFPRPPAPGSLATCDTAGVLGPAASMVAAVQSAQALKVLSGNIDAVSGGLLSFDLWAERYAMICTDSARQADCPCCGQRQFEFLESPHAGRAASLCGRNAVQVHARPDGGRLDLNLAASRLAAGGDVERNPYFVRCRLREHEGLSLTVFPDGRVIVQGTADAARARSMVSRYVGS